MLGQQNDLIHVSGIVQQLACDRLQDRVLASGDKHFPLQVLRREWSYCLKNALPSPFPPLVHVRAGSVRINFEFLIAMAVEFFAVSSQKVCPTGTHVSRHMEEQ